MRCAKRVALPTAAQLFGGELPHRFEQAVARSGAAMLHRDEGRVDKPGQCRQHAGHTNAGAADLLCRLERERAGEDREPPEQDAFVVTEQVVAPRECRGKCLLAVDGRTVAATQKL